MRPIFYGARTPALVRQAAAQALFAPLANVRVLQGDWKELLAYGPFALLFCDTKAKEQEPEAVLAALAVGGMVVLDDLTPEEHWPLEWRGRPEPQRTFWLNDPRVVATEVRVTATSAVILATRVGGGASRGTGRNAGGLRCAQNQQGSQRLWLPC